MARAGRRRGAQPAAAPTARPPPPRPCIPHAPSCSRKDPSSHGSLVVHHQGRDGPSNVCRRASGADADVRRDGRASTVNHNVVPRPGSLSTPMAPPIASLSRLQMARPRPGAPVLARGRGSAWKTASNSRGATVGPRCRCPCRPPRIEASSEASHAAPAHADRHARPRAVNLIALPTRFSRIWRSRPGIADDDPRARPAASTQHQLEALGLGARGQEIQTSSIDDQRQIEVDAPRAPAGPPRSSRSPGCR